VRSDVAALYVDPRGPYPKLVEHWYDEKRDARTYAGPWPVVAHPPCGPWANLRHLTRGDWTEVKQLAPIAIGQVRKWGGVLEHPAGSTLWTIAGLPAPWPPQQDEYGGFTCEVEQCAWGHPARKRTWLYCVGVDIDLMIATVRKGGTPTHWCSGGRTKRPGMGATVPPGIKVCSAQQRRRTPVAFAEWLLSLAASVTMAACSSRPAPPVPADAGSECAECWMRCGEATSRKEASLCAWQCGLLCESEGR